MAKPPKKLKPEKIETEPDGWDRFQRTMDKIVPPRHAPIVEDQLQFLVIENRFRVAGNVRHNDDGSITADLYRNLDDFRSGRMMECAATFNTD